jgi:hypothetical protein
MKCNQCSNKLEEDEDGELLEEDDDGNSLFFYCNECDTDEENPLCPDCVTEFENCEIFLCNKCLKTETKTVEKIVEKIVYVNSGSKNQESETAEEFTKRIMGS